MKFYLKVMVLVSVLVAVSPAMASVKSISLERTFVGDNIRVLEVAVKCRFDKGQRKLRKISSTSNPWCSIDLPEVCAVRKVMAAREICQYSRTEFQDLLANKKSKKNNEKPTLKESADDLIQEKMFIEEQRIRIAQLRIELKRKELTLRKALSENPSSVLFP